VAPRFLNTYRSGELSVDSFTRRFEKVGGGLKAWRKNPKRTGVRDPLKKGRQGNRPKTVLKNVHTGGYTVH